MAAYKDAKKTERSETEELRGWASPRSREKCRSSCASFFCGRSLSQLCRALLWSDGPTTPRYNKIVCADSATGEKRRRRDGAERRGQIVKRSYSSQSPYLSCWTLCDAQTVVSAAQCAVISTRPSHHRLLAVRLEFPAALTPLRRPPRLPALALAVSPLPVVRGCPL